MFGSIEGSLGHPALGDLLKFLAKRKKDDDKNGNFGVLRDFLDFFPSNGR